MGLKDLETKILATLGERKKESCSVQLKKKNPAKKALKKNGQSFKNKNLTCSPAQKKMLHGLNLPIPLPSSLKNQMVRPLECHSSCN